MIVMETSLMFLSSELRVSVLKPSKGHHKTFICRLLSKCGLALNPRPAGVWLVTRPAGGGPKGPP